MGTTIRTGGPPSTVGYDTGAGEVLTNKIYNGKPVYRMFVDAGVGVNDGITKITAHGITGMELLVDLRVFVFDAVESGGLSCARVNTLTDCVSNIRVSATDVEWYMYSPLGDDAFNGGIALIMLEYTKV